MARPDRGTVEWFKREKRLIIEYAKAVEAFATAGRNFQKLVDLGDSADAEVRAALHSAGVVNYARPFSNNRPADGGASIIFPKKLIKGHANFSEDIHNQLLDLRHKLIVHSDGDYADGRLFRKMVTVGGGVKPPLKMLAGITVLTQTGDCTAHSAHGAPIQPRDILAASILLAYHASRCIILWRRYQRRSGSREG